MDTQLISDKEAKAQRDSLLQTELSRYLKLIKQYYKPYKIYLFGSMAAGTTNRWSDLDMVIVADTKERFLERTRQVMTLLRPRIGLDILVYTPEEFAQMREDRTFMQSEIIEKGRLLYERS
ncbi:MAG: nucleotidyltransferase domain-containing protein [Candidatus Promineifilaceae bacterium]